jgi:hypothetical protein
MTKVDYSGRTRKYLLPPCPVDYIGVDYKNRLSSRNKTKEIQIHHQ